MKDRMVKMRIREDIYLRYRAFCALKDLSVPKQTTQLIEQFVKIQEENDLKIKHAKGES
jgi:hypothetical protein